MIRFTISVFVALILGCVIGWNLRYVTKDGPDGIQWDFNDAASRGDIGEMRRLISAGANPLDFPSYADGSVSGATPLLEASSSGQPDSVKFLIDLGGDVNSHESDATPLGSARYRLQQTQETINLLLAAGAKDLKELSRDATNGEQAGATNRLPAAESKLNDD